MASPGISAGWAPVLGGILLGGERLPAGSGVMAVGCSWGLRRCAKRGGARVRSGHPAP